MRVLFIVAASLAGVTPKDQVAQKISRSIRDKLRSDEDEWSILCPQDIALDSGLVTGAAYCGRYAGEIGLERSASIWRPVGEIEFDEIVVLGRDQNADYREIVLSCFIKAGKKTYMSRLAEAMPIDQWQRHVRFDLHDREVVVKSLPEPVQLEYFRGMHRWLATELISSDFNFPRRLHERVPEVSQYLQGRLDDDLADQAYDLRPGRPGTPFAAFAFDGRLVLSSDYFRSIANFVQSIDGIDSVLDVGCGSGFLACHLAASGRYGSVTGVDSSPTRIDGARLHGTLVGTTARFDVMSMTDLKLPDASVDLSVTMYALEQTGDHLPRALAEIRRVTRRMMVLVEPTAEFFPTLTSVWHVPRLGWASSYARSLGELSLPYAVRPNLLNHYQNTGTVFVIDLASDIHPQVRFPQLFRPSPTDWPGGVRLVA